MYSRKTETRRAASVYTHPHTDAPVMSLERPPWPTDPNIHNLPEECAQERDLCGRTGHSAALCTAKGWDSSSLEPNDPLTAVILQGMIALHTIALLMSLQQRDLHGDFSLHFLLWEFGAHNQIFFFSTPLHFIGLCNLRKWTPNPQTSLCFHFPVFPWRFSEYSSLPCVSR